MQQTESRPPLPPFDAETAARKVRMAEDAWNTRDPERVAGAYTPDSRWRNRSEFITGRAEIVEFLRRKWATELDYRLVKEVWAFHDNRIAVRFVYEWHDDADHWFRAHGSVPRRPNSQALQCAARFGPRARYKAESSPSAFFGSTSSSTPSSPSKCA